MQIVSLKFCIGYRIFLISLQPKRVIFRTPFDTEQALFYYDEDGEFF